MPHDALTTALNGLFERAGDSFGMLMLELRADNILPLVNRLRAEFEFELFLDVTAIDYPQRSPRFDVVYHFYSRKHNRRIRLKVPVPEDRPVVPTLTALIGCLRGEQPWPDPPFDLPEDEHVPIADLSDIRGQLVARRAL